jgi:hypothetical protein
LIGDGEGYSPHARVLKRTAEFNPGSSVSIVLSKNTVALGKNMSLELQVMILLILILFYFRHIVFVTYLFIIVKTTTTTTTTTLGVEG